MLHLSGLLSASSLASKICYASRQPGLPLQGQTLRSLALTRKFLAAPVFPPEDNKLTGRKEVDTMVDKPLASKIDEVEEEIKRARQELESLEKRLHSAFEKFLKRLQQEKE